MLILVWIMDNAVTRIKMENMLIFYCFIVCSQKVNQKLINYQDKPQKQFFFLICFIFLTLVFFVLLIFAPVQPLPILASTDPASSLAPLHTPLHRLLLLAEPAALLLPVLTAGTLLASRTCRVNLAILTLFTDFRQESIPTTSCCGGAGEEQGK